MTFFKQNSARHRAETPSHVVRNTTIAAAAGAAIVGSVAPAQASASYQAPAASTSAYAAPSTSWSWTASGGYTWYSSQAPASTHQAPAVASYQAPAAQTASVSSLTPQSTVSGKGASIAAAAMGQLGVSQSCTELVTNALRAVGIEHAGWPASYLGLGTQVSAGEAQPGDLVYYVDGGMGLAHIAVYIGDGKAVHGGWNGNQTAVESVNVGSGPVYVRVH